MMLTMACALLNKTTLFRRLILCITSAVLLASCGKQVASEQVTGIFTKGFETWEIRYQDNVLFVADPKGLLTQRIADEHRQQAKLWLSFPLCVEGIVNDKGGYGPNGKYPRMITIAALCQRS